MTTARCFCWRCMFSSASSNYRDSIMATSSSVKTTTYETRTSYESDTTGTTPVYRATMTPRNLIIQRTYAGPSGSSSVSRSERLFSLIGVIFPGYEGYAYTPLFKVGYTRKR